MTGDAYDNACRLPPSHRATSAAIPGAGSAQVPFRVVPNHSGFAPGVDPNQIKTILDDMEVEDYLRKALNH